MLLYPPMNKLLNNISSRYLLVNVVAQRARQISKEADAKEADESHTSLTEKPVSMAVQEVADGVLTVDAEV